MSKAIAVRYWVRTTKHAWHALLRGHDVRAVALIDRHVFGVRARGRQKWRPKHIQHAMLLTDAVLDVIRRNVVRCPHPSVQSSPAHTLLHHTQRKTPTHQT